MGIRSAGVVVIFSLAVLAGSVEAGSYVSSVLADNPVGYWRLEEGGGVAVDSSAKLGSQDGSYLGSLTTMTGAIVSESQNLAANFMNVNSLVYVPDPGGVLGTDVTVNSWTIEVWMYWTVAATQHGGPVVKGDYPTHGATFFNADRDITKITFGINSGDSGVLASSPYPPLNTWTHYVGVLEADGSDTKATLYANGSLASSLTISGHPDPNITTDPLTIGALLSGTGYINWFNGAVDEVAVYDYALSADRVAAHFNAATALASVPLPTAAWAGLGLLGLMGAVRRYTRRSGA